MNHSVFANFQTCKEPCWIEPSSKLGAGEVQYIVRSKRYVFFRIVERTRKNFVVMTATAAEDTQDYQQFPNQALVIRTLAASVSGLGQQPQAKEDREGRAYVEITITATEAQLAAFIENMLAWIEMSEPLS